RHCGSLWRQPCSRPRGLANTCRGDAKVRSKKWVLIEVIAVGDATSATGSEKAISIRSLEEASKTGLAATIEAASAAAAIAAASAAAAIAAAVAAVVSAAVAV